MLKEIEVKLLHADSKSPKRAEDSIGYDLYSYESLVLEPLGLVVVDLGISIGFEGNYGAFIWDRSSMGSKGIRALGLCKEQDTYINIRGNYLQTGTLSKHAGCIEGSYRGPWKVVLVNVGTRPYTITKGDRIAQVVFQEVELPSVKVVNELKSSLRGEGGFGSTGK